VPYRPGLPLKRQGRAPQAVHQLPRWPSRLGGVPVGASSGRRYPAPNSRTPRVFSPPGPTALWLLLGSLHFSSPCPSLPPRSPRPLAAGLPANELRRCSIRLAGGAPRDPPRRRRSRAWTHRTPCCPFSQCCPALRAVLPWKGREGWKCRQKPTGDDHGSCHVRTHGSVHAGLTGPSRVASTARVLVGHARLRAVRSTALPHVPSFACLLACLLAYLALLLL